MQNNNRIIYHVEAKIAEKAGKTPLIQECCLKGRIPVETIPRTTNAQ